MKRTTALKHATIFVFLALVSVVPECRSVCTVESAVFCSITYTLNVGLAPLDSVEQLCSSLTEHGKTLEECIQTAECEADYGTSASRKKEMYENVFDALICKPSSECSLLNALTCYQPLFDLIGVEVPTNAKKTAQFLDDLPLNLYGNSDKICSAVKNGDIDYDAMGQCTNRKFGEISSGCIQPELEEGEDIDDLNTKFKSLMAGATDPEKLKESTTETCDPLSCSNFLSRFASVEDCSKSAYNQLKSASTDPSEQNTCAWMTQMLLCVGPYATSCSALVQELVSNPELAIMAAQCGLSLDAPTLCAHYISILLPIILTVMFVNA